MLKDKKQMLRTIPKGFIVLNDSEGCFWVIRVADIHTVAESGKKRVEGLETLVSTLHDCVFVEESIQTVLMLMSNTLGDAANMY